MKIVQPQRLGGLRCTGDRFRRDLNPGQLHLRRGTVQAKAANAAEEIPHMVNRKLAHPVPRRGVELAGDRRVGLEKALRTNSERHAVEVLRQCLLVGKKDLPLPFHDRHMHRLDIYRNHLQLRQLRL